MKMIKTGEKNTINAETLIAIPENIQYIERS